MARYRMKCPNPNCDCMGPMIGTPSGTQVKKHFADINRKKHGGSTADEKMLLRCSKCKHRWRARTKTLIPY